MDTAVQDAEGQRAGSRHRWWAQMLSLYSYNRETPASWVSRSNYCLCWDHSSNVFYFSYLSSQTRRESPMEVTALQKPFAPVYKLHSQAISTSHQLLCVDFQTPSCSPVLSHSLQTTFLNLVRVQSPLMKGMAFPIHRLLLRLEFAASLSPLPSLRLTPEIFSNPHLDSLTHNMIDNSPKIFLGEWRGCKALL